MSTVTKRIRRIALGAIATVTLVGVGVAGGATALTAAPASSSHTVVVADGHWSGG
jgi:hypothetical protein